MDDARENADPIAATRRFLEDLELFEGRSFLVPGASAEAAKKRAPVVDEVIAPVAPVDMAEKGEVQQPAVARETPEPAVAAADELAAPAEQSGGELELFREEICACQNCRLGETRGHFVFGAGRADADIMFVGEAPGADEDRSGQPFVGAAGQLLNKIIEAMGLAREEVYICNILKCRPPNNRDPQPDEIEQCEPYLKRQIELIQPRVICTLGRFAAQTLLRSDQSMGRLRQQEHRYQGIPLIATYHPAALLRNAQWKRPTWEDMKKVRRLYDGVEL